MKQEITYNDNPETAIQDAMAYNRAGYAKLLGIVKADAKADADGGKVTQKELRFLFSFAGVQGYPVRAITERWQAKGWIATA